MRYWLVKSEPDCFSFADLMRAPKRTTGWDGVRNYQARNFMRDDMRVGDGVLFYHSSAPPPAIAGIAEVARAAYPDPTQFDTKSEYFDPKASKDAPTWMQVDVRGVKPLAEPLTLDRLRKVPELDGMELLKKGSRLSVQPVTEGEWSAIMELAGLAWPNGS
ncbi:MAG: EVE domain-containing protein [Gemmatimonadaceae bacterium]|nr:EVE domain-containing protein [Gemmatimonadaceae bacterium]